MPKTPRRMRQQSMKRSKVELPPNERIRALIDGQGRLALRVTAGARQEALIIEGGKLTLKVRAKPQDGAANQAVIKLLAQALGIAPTRIALLRGTTSREKLVRVSI